MNTGKHKLVKSLPLISVFHTIQGEGFFAGTPALFIRLGGCDVGCHWCDTKDSWDISQYKYVSVRDIVNKAEEYKTKIAVITGGEPLMYNLELLTGSLIQKGFRTHLETSGAYPLSGKWHWICLSPKKTKLPLKEIYKKADELKVVIYNKNDFRFAEECTAQLPYPLGGGRGWSAKGRTPSFFAEGFLQPEWSRKDKMMPLIIDYVKNNPQWRISVQVHKYLNIP